MTVARCNACGLYRFLILGRSGKCPIEARASIKHPFSPIRWALTLTLIAARIKSLVGAMVGSNETLLSLFPTADELLEVHPEELAPLLLRFAAGRGAMFWPAGVTEIKIGSGGTTEREFGYPYHKKHQIEALLGETWECLRRDGLIMPAPDQNGRNGYMVLTRAGRAALIEGGLEGVKAARILPKDLLHPAIAKKALAAFRRGDYDEALREAFITVEVRVREAGRYPQEEIGIDLMRSAFNAKSGKLTDMSLHEREREGYAHIFAGAIGAFKNPHSHRTPVVTDPLTAIDQLLFASHLLRIVDTRRKG